MQRCSTSNMRRSFNRVYAKLQSVRGSFLSRRQLCAGLMYPPSVVELSALVSRRVPTDTNSWECSVLFHRTAICVSSVIDTTGWLRGGLHACV